MLIDTHSHISDPEFDEDRAEVIARAKAAGVEKLLVIGTGLASSQRAVALAAEHDFIFAAVGLHPHEAKDLDDVMLGELDVLSNHEKVVAWGEMGFDLYYNHSDLKQQRGAFIEQVRLAKTKKLPLVIHTRDAWKETFDLIREEKLEEHARECGAVFHCFTGDKAVAEEGVSLGFHLSFSGIMTFPKAKEVQEAAAAIDLRHIVIETDAPYLAPQGHRGRRNEPAYVRVVAEKLAKIKDLPFEDVCDRTSKNAEALFGLSRA